MTNTSSSIDKKVGEPAKANISYTYNPKPAPMKIEVIPNQGSTPQKVKETAPVLQTK